RMAAVDGKRGWALLGPAALGIVIVHACALIPVVNVIICIAGLIVGVGAIATVCYEEFRLFRAGEGTNLMTKTVHVTKTV
ncbi:MAG TPA: hypothetical protein VMM80_03055, partial [Bacteroidota bacterium]|nr:hypothetical protein [Bacteroidota bacterium]